MFKRLLLLTLFASLLSGVACSRRMAPFSPHLPPSAAHLSANNQDCLGCHDITRLADHQPADNCKRCHRILHGE